MCIYLLLMNEVYSGGQLVIQMWTWSDFPAPGETCTVEDGLPLTADLSALINSAFPDL